MSLTKQQLSRAAVCISRQQRDMITIRLENQFGDYVDSVTAGANYFLENGNLNKGSEEFFSNQYAHRIVIKVEL